MRGPKKLVAIIAARRARSHLAAGSEHTSALSRGGPLGIRQFAPSVMRPEASHAEGCVAIGSAGADHGFAAAGVSKQQSQYIREASTRGPPQLGAILAAGRARPQLAADSERTSAVCGGGALSFRHLAAQIPRPVAAVAKCWLAAQIPRPVAAEAEC